MKSEDSKTFYRQVVEFKGMLRSKIKHLEKVPLMKTFPDNPHDLPEEVFNRVNRCKIARPPLDCLPGYPAARAMAL